MVGIGLVGGLAGRLLRLFGGFLIGCSPLMKKSAMLWRRKRVVIGDIVVVDEPFPIGMVVGLLSMGCQLGRGFIVARLHAQLVIM